MMHVIAFLRLRSLLIVAFAFSVTAPLAAQQGTSDIPLGIGTPVLIQMVQDTTWYEADITGVGQCMTVTRDSDRTSDGYIAHPFSSISALRVVERPGVYRTMNEAQRQRLAGCVVGGGPAPTSNLPAACGTNPSFAIAGISGFLYGMQSRAGEGGPWEPYAFLTKEQITPITSAAECERIVTAVNRARAGQPADTLPVQGIIDLGGAATVVIRGTLPSGPGQHFQTSRALISKELVLTTYEQSSY